MTDTKEMNTQEQVCQSPNYKPVHNHGFVGLVDMMGDDSAIVQAARVSYGAGTKKVNEDRGLIRYLVRHSHTTPLEMVEVKFHIKLPIFVMRQWIRHRTANVNEYSGRYSEMSNEFYIPSLEDIQPQSSTNKQGREDSKDFDGYTREIARGIIEGHSEESYKVYESLLGKDKGWEHQGISRELARIVLPNNNFTEFYWKCDLHNIMHFLRLRLDFHAQKEIRDYAEATYQLLKETNRIPFALEAFEDYKKEAKTFSRMELKFLQYVMQTIGSFQNFADVEWSLNQTAKDLGLSEREKTELLDKIRPLIPTK